MALNLYTQSMNLASVFVFFKIWPRQFPPLSLLLLLPSLPSQEHNCRIGGAGGKSLYDKSRPMHFKCTLYIPGRMGSVYPKVKKHSAVKFCCHSV